MTLASSGTISIGGSTANRSINQELGRSATATSSLGETSLRTLAGVSSGAISLSNFHGKSNYLDQQTVTVGFVGPSSWSSSRSYGYIVGHTGSISDGTCNFKSNADINRLRSRISSGVFTSESSYVNFNLVGGNHSNSGFTNMNIENTSFARTDASFTSYPSTSDWTWSTSSNPFGTTVGATKTVTWT